MFFRLIIQIIFAVNIIYSVFSIETRCPVNWTPHASSTKCYYFSTSIQRYDWQASRDYCQDRGGDLVVIVNNDDKNWVNAEAGVQFGDTLFWVGIKDTTGKNNWLWVDNRTISTAITPLLATKKGNCGQLDHQGKIAGMSCNDVQYFVCDRQLDIQILCDIDFGWEHIGSRCYKYFEENMEWEDSLYECQYYGSDLIVINNKLENDFVAEKAKLNKKNIWIGFTNMWNDEYSWINEKKDNYTLWGPNEPKENTSDSCGMLPYSGNNAWKTANCYLEYPFICEKGEGRCSVGWVPYASSCYQYNLNRKFSRTWYEAKSTCEAQGAKLLVIDDYREQHIIIYDLKDFQDNSDNHLNVWIGLSDVSRVPLDYVWVDGKTPAQKSYTNWLGGNVTGFSNSTNCINILAGDTRGYWFAESCNTIMSFICEAPLGTIIKPISPTHAPLYCSTGWSQFGDDCYLPVKKSQTWSQSQKSCLDNGANLASITSRAENTWISNNFMTDFWIGYNDRQESNVFTWIDGTISKFTNWDAGEPNNGGNTGKDENCVQILYVGYYNTKRGKWNDMFCEKLSQSICKKKADVNPSPTPPVQSTTSWSVKCGAYWLEDPNSHNCYRYEIERLSWRDARTHCQSYQGDLVSILSFEEQRFINDMMQRAVNEDPTIIEFWSGFNDRDVEGIWVWIDRKPSPYFNWNEGEPNNADDEDCGTIFAGHGRWNDLHCERRLPYFCKKSRGATPIPTMPTYPIPSPGQRYGCLPNWFEYRRECYYYSDNKKNWNDAMDTCKSMTASGNLASIKTATEQNNIVLSISKYANNERFWIGFNDLVRQFEFKWSDGSPVTYTNWKSNEPNHYGGSNEDCVNIVKQSVQNGGWNDDLCTSNWYYICRARKQLLNTPTVLPTEPGCTTGFFAHDYSCYNFQIKGMTWDEANTSCKALGGDLIDILDRYEQSFITGIISQLNQVGDFWIGLTSKKEYNKYEWSSERKVSFTFWANNEPAGGINWCVAASSASTSLASWRTVSCSTKLNSICKMSRKGYSQPTTPTTTVAPIKCPLGWSEFEEFCYKKGLPYSYSVKESFSQASASCQRYGAELVSIHKKAEEDFLFSALSLYDGSYWIGLRSHDGTGHYWLDGTATNYVNWIEGEPDNHNGLELCVELSTYSPRGWADTPCEVRKNYICKASKSTLSNSTFTTGTTVKTTPAVVCGGSTSWKLFNGDCYYFSTSYPLYQWSQAREKCRTMNAELASIKNAQEQGFILSNIQGQYSYATKVWIGLHALHEYNRYEWSDGTPFSFNNWAKGEPNNYGGAEACGSMYTNNGFWNDDNCAVNIGIVCRKPNNTEYYTNPPPTIGIGNCPSGWNQYDGTCYKLFKELKTWDAARNDCQIQDSSKSDLTSIHNKNEQEFLITLLYKVEGNVWIGLHDLVKNRQFVWSDNSRWDYSNWKGDSPVYNWNVKNEYCVGMSTKKQEIGRWNDQACENKNFYICQRKVDATIPVSPAPPVCKNYRNFYQFGENCFMLLNEPHTWEESKTLCQSEASGAAVLASVSNIFEQTYIKTFFRIDSPIWIGLSRESIDKGFRWTNDFPLYYTNWAPLAPSNIEGDNFVNILPNGFWNASRGDQMFRGLCKIEYEKITTVVPIVEGICPPPTTSWIPSLGQYCYFYAKYSSYNFAKASMECRLLRGSLAVFNNKEEYEHAIEMFENTKTRMWIGLYRKHDGIFEWIDDSPVTFTNWNEGEPNNQDSEDCVEVLQNNKWNDVNCDIAKSFLCQVKKIVVTTVSTIPSITSTIPASTPSITPTITKSIITPTTAPTQTPPEKSSSVNTPVICTDNCDTAAPQYQNEVKKLDTGSLVAIIEAVACIVVIAIIATFVIRRHQKNKPPKPGTVHSIDNILYNATDDSVDLENSYKKKGIYS